MYIISEYIVCVCVYRQNILNQTTYNCEVSKPCAMTTSIYARCDVYNCQKREPCSAIQGEDLIARVKLVSFPVPLNNQFATAMYSSYSIFPVYAYYVVLVLVLLVVIVVVVIIIIIIISSSSNFSIHTMCHDRDYITSTSVLCTLVCTSGWMIPMQPGLPGNKGDSRGIPYYI